ncbi:MAG: phytoene desaturase family protein [Phototrophicaceae bacterium]
MTHPTLVIGGGIGGLATAIRLQAAGHQVIILEKNALVGGKMYQVERDGFRFDTGPSVITMRHVFAELFEHVGRKLEDYLELLPVDPMTRYFYSDGFVLDASSDISKMAQQIEAIDEHDVEGYLAYLSYAAKIHRITGETFIYNQPPTLASVFSQPPWRMMQSDPFRTMNGAIKSFVKSDKLRQLLGRFATYVGGSPYLAPATLNVIAHVELTGGVWYPRGGIYQIAQAMEKLALELGVEIRTHHGVDKIRVKDGHVTGVLLEDGSEIDTRIVISNVDVAMTYHKLLADSGLPQSRITKMSNYDPSCSGFVMLLGINGSFEALAHHNIFFSDDYPAEFEAIFKKGIPADDPTIYVSITSKTDASHAPDGCENWFVLVNAPPLSDTYDWEQHKQGYRQLILDKLAARGLDVRDKILTEVIFTPADLQEMSGAWLGALYGPSANDRFAVFLRPHNRSKDIRGLYFAGGTTHPGGGVPMVTLSGKVAANMVLEDNL